MATSYVACVSTKSTTAAREIEPLDEAECRRLLGQSGIGRLVVVVGHQPDIFPVNYIVEHVDGDSDDPDDDRAVDEIVIRTAEGTKLAAALMDRNVAFEIDAFDPTHHAGWSVVVHGTAHESRTLPAVMHDGDLPVEPWAAGVKLRHIRITIDTITGRRIPPSQEAVTEVQP